MVGVGGVDRRAAFWNLYYVIDVDHQGFGYATELARAGAQAAAALDPSLPLVAWIHAGNDARDTRGCILVGNWTGGEIIHNARIALQAVMDMLEIATIGRQPIEIEVVDP